MEDAWVGGSIGAISEADVHRAATDNLGLGQQQLAEFMADLWREYLGTANTELIEYARGLRPRYRTGILSNSFVGAREREQAAYGFEAARQARAEDSLTTFSAERASGQV
jgi:putative hydrolase of the HAD superfamily